MSDGATDKQLIGKAQEVWLVYLEALDPVRPDLFRYCRRLTGNVWDAEDLAQDAVEQGFSRFVMSGGTIANPRGYVLRIASNLWISRLRHARLERESAREGRSEHLQPQPAPAPDSSSALRDAGAALLLQLAPQERAAVVLKEVFDLSLEEIADTLSTSVGAVKAALHRGRERLREPEPEHASRAALPSEVIDRFVEHYNKRDLPAMLEMMLDNASIGMPGTGEYVGRSVWGRKGGWFTHNFYSVVDGKPSTGSWQTAVHAGQPVVLVLDADGQVTSVMRIATEADKIQHIHVYAGCPDLVREVATGLGRKYGGWGMYHLPRAILQRLNAEGAMSGRKAAELSGPESDSDQLPRVPAPRLKSQ